MPAGCSPVVQLDVSRLHRSPSPVLSVLRYRRLPQKQSDDHRGCSYTQQAQAQSERDARFTGLWQQGYDLHLLYWNHHSWRVRLPYRRFRCVLLGPDGDLRLLRWILRWVRWRILRRILWRVLWRILRRILRWVLWRILRRVLRRILWWVLRWVLWRILWRVLRWILWRILRRVLWRIFWLYTVCDVITAGIDQVISYPINYYTSA